MKIFHSIKYIFKVKLAHKLMYCYLSYWLHRIMLVLSILYYSWSCGDMNVNQLGICCDFTPGIQNICSKKGKTWKAGGAFFRISTYWTSWRYIINVCLGLTGIRHCFSVTSELWIYLNKVWLNCWFFNISGQNILDLTSESSFHPKNEPFSVGKCILNQSPTVAM